MAAFTLMCVPLIRLLTEKGQLMTFEQAFANFLAELGMSSTDRSPEAFVIRTAFAEGWRMRGEFASQ